MKFIDLEIIRYCLDFYFAVDSNLLASFCAQELPGVLKNRAPSTGPLSVHEFVR